MAPYERLRAWQLAHRLALETYRVTAQLPATERFGLLTQSRRSAFSVAANIAEGSAKRGRPEFRRYLDVALGSLAELGYAFRLMADLGYARADDLERIERLRDEASRVTWGLYRTMARRPTRTV
jgi:four helix bundle protein